MDPYNLAAGNPLVIDNILNTGSYGKAIQHQIQWGGSANGTLFELPGGAVKAALGGLHRVERVVKLGVFVNSAPGFTDQPKVANGASDLMFALFGDAGRHARSAVGVSALPLGAAVEVDAIIQIATK